MLHLVLSITKKELNALESFFEFWRKLLTKFCLASQTDGMEKGGAGESTVSGFEAVASRT